MAGYSNSSPSCAPVRSIRRTSRSTTGRRNGSTSTTITRDRSPRSNGRTTTGSTSSPARTFRTSLSTMPSVRVIKCDWPTNRPSSTIRRSTRSYCSGLPRASARRWAGVATRSIAICLIGPMPRSRPSKSRISIGNIWALKACSRAISVFSALLKHSEDDRIRVLNTEDGFSTEVVTDYNVANCSIGQA